MNSAIVVITKPDLSTIENQQAWDALQATISNILNNNGMHQDNQQNPQKPLEKLGENVLLFDLKLSFSKFVELTSVAQARQLSYQVLFLEKELEWIRHNPFETPS